jgi:hypothetical protein
VQRIAAVGKVFFELPVAAEPFQGGGRTTERCICRECHPGWSGGMLVLVEDAAEAITSADMQAASQSESVIGSGSRGSGRAFAMP